MLVVLGVAVTASKVTAALVEVDVPSLGPVDERVTPLGDNSATVGDAVAAAIGVMRLRAIQNGLDLRGTVVSSANRAQRESISAELKSHRIDDVDVVDATYLSPVFEPSVSTAMWNADGVGRVARNPVDSDESVEPVTASRMEKFGMAQKARNAERALATDRLAGGEKSPSRVGNHRVEATAESGIDNRSRTTAVVEAPSVPATRVDKSAVAPAIVSTSEVSEVPKAELEIPVAIAVPPAAEERSPRGKPGVLDLGAETNDSYKSVSSYADTAETTAIDSAAIVAAVQAESRNSGPTDTPEPAAPRRPARPVVPQMDPYDSPMTVPIDIVGPMVTRPAQADNRERGAALIIAVVVSLILAGVLAIWAISGAVKTSEPEAPGAVGSSSPSTSETSASVVPPVEAPAQNPGVATEPSLAPPIESTDSENAADQVIAPPVEVEGAPARGTTARLSRTTTDQVGSSPVASNQVNAPVDSAPAGRPTIGGSRTAPTKVTVEPAATPVDTAPSTIPTESTAVGTSGQADGVAGADTSPTNSGE